MSAYIRYVPTTLGGGGGGSPQLTMGTYDGQPHAANGATITLNQLFLQSATSSFPGLVVVGNITDAGTDGIVITGGTGAIVGSGVTLAQHVADSTHNGYLSSTDWSTFNAKQPAGNYITALTGDVTAAGPGSVAATLATVNANVGSFSPAALTVNAKGLITAASNVTTGNLTDVGTDGIVITSGTGAVLGSGTSIAQHVADTTHNGYLSSTDWNTFNSKQTAGNYITALTGDGTASGPGSAAFTLATVNSNVGSFGTATATGTFTVNAKGLVTAASSTSIQIAESQVTNLVSDLAAKQATVSIGAFNNTSNSTGLDLTSAVLALHAASGTNPGGVSTTTQTFAGAKTFLSPVAIGSVGGTVGELDLLGSSTGIVSVLVQAAAGTYNFNLPTTAGTTGQALISAGGVGSPMTWGSVLTNPMTTLGDTIYENVTPAPTRLAGNTTSTINFLGQTGTGSVSAAPVWTAFTAPTVQKFTATGTTTGWLFTVSTTTTVAVGDTYTDGGAHTYTVLAALTAQTGMVLYTSGVPTPTGGTLTRATGSGTASITYTSAINLATYTTPTSPRKPLYLRLRLIGGGGGGAGSGSTTASSGTHGENTIFGPLMCVASGGVGGTYAGDGGVGGTFSLGTAVGIGMQGNNGCAPTSIVAGTIAAAGNPGGAGPIGGGSGSARSVGTSLTPANNSGGGGSGAGTNNTASVAGGAGGGAGAYIDAMVFSPATTYVYYIAQASGGGAAGTGGLAGAAGAGGQLEVTEFYQ